MNMRCRNELSSNVFIEITKRLNTINSNENNISCLKYSLKEHILQRKLVIKESRKAKYLVRYKNKNKSYAFKDQLIEKKLRTKKK